MMASRIGYKEWQTRPDLGFSEGPVFCVSTGAAASPLWIHVLLASSDVSALQQAMGVQERGREAHPQLQRAVLRYAVQRLEQGLREALFPTAPTDSTYDLLLEETDRWALQQLLQEKTCAYQVQEGRDLFCSAAVEQEDKTIVGRVGIRAIAPTSHPLCQQCDLPDTDYLCSHLVHPRIGALSMRGAPRERHLFGALCDLNQPQISQPSQCHAGGHACWERLVKLEPERPVGPLSPLTLAEAFDYLDTCWRLAFGKRKALLRPKNATEMVVLSLPCATRDEFSTRLSALADILKSMDIPDELLPEEKRLTPKDQTFNRMLACLQEHLAVEDYHACKAAVDVLRVMNNIRVSLQHTTTSRPLPEILEPLGIPYPLPSWSETWDRLRAKTAEALVQFQ